MDGLYLVMDDRIVDAEGKMGYSYPGDVSMYLRRLLPVLLVQGKFV